MQNYLINGRVYLSLKVRINLENYFEFLEEFFQLFKIKFEPRKKITGNHFKI